MSDRGPIHRDYAPDLSTPGQTQRIGRPRPGYGTVYVHLRNVGERELRFIWAAEWVDGFGKPNTNGEIAGIDSMEGDRDEVLPWVRSRAAAERLVPGSEGWEPTPQEDDDVVLRVPTFPSSRRP
jgi:hypothetical protein